MKKILKRIIKFLQPTCKDKKHRDLWEALIGCQIFFLQKHQMEYDGPVATHCPFCGKKLKDDL